jgi:hypothetical protein
MATEDRKRVQLTKEDAESLARKMEAWLPQLTPGERAVLGAAMTPDAVEGDDAQGFTVSARELGSAITQHLGGSSPLRPVRRCYCFSVYGVRVPNPQCPIH